MLCEDCKKNQACVHLTQISNGKKEEKHLCQACAKAYGDFIFPEEQKFSVNDFLAGMFHSNLADAQQPQEETCPNCGMTYRDFSRTGKIGCSVCYKTFAAKLEPILRRIHGASGHTGKIPKRTGGRIELRQRCAALRAALQRHVAKEEYEEAAKLRDEIKALESALAEEA